MKEIPLTQGKSALVDDEDYPRLSKPRWYAQKDGRTWYAGRHSQTDPAGNRHLILMHRAIIDLPKGMEIDHINGNGLDNRKENLRVVTKRQNQQNWHIRKTSKYPGVGWHKGKGRWQAQIRIKGKKTHLGYFTDELEAATTYSVACAVLCGVE